MSRLIPHGSKQGSCLFALACAAQITGIPYDTLYKRYHRGALKAVKYSGLLFMDYKELMKLINTKKADDERRN